MKKNLSSIDITAIVNELQFLVNGKLSQIYQTDKREMLLQCHAKEIGKVLLKIIPKKLLCITSKKDTPPKPSGFCMQLRKYLSNSIIREIYQKESERIIIINLEKEETYYLIIELFSKGNIIFCDKNYKIFGVLERQIWKDRTIKEKESYIFPTSKINWKTINYIQIHEIFQQIDKKNLATALATSIGLGGPYAEEICRRTGINKDLKPNEISIEQCKSISNTLQGLDLLLKNPKGYIYNDNISPFPLTGKDIVHFYDTFSKALDTIKTNEKTITPYENKIRALQRTIESQKEAILDQEKKIELNKKKGELIYEKYISLNKLLETIKELKKTKEWSEIEIILKKNTPIKNIDLKNKKITLDLTSFSN